MVRKMGDITLKKIFEVYIKEREFSNVLTEDDQRIKIEYIKSIDYLIKNLKDSRAIAWVIRDLTRWQEQIIEGLVNINE